jgi:hypothetical protein
MESAVDISALRNVFTSSNTLRKPLRRLKRKTSRDDILPVEKLKYSNRSGIIVEPVQCPSTRHARA